MSDSENVPQGQGVPGDSPEPEVMGIAFRMTPEGLEVHVFLAVPDQDSERKAVAQWN